MQGKYGGSKTLDQIDASCRPPMGTQTLDDAGAWTGAKYGQRARSGPQAGPCRYEYIQEQLNSAQQGANLPRRFEPSTRRGCSTAVDQARTMGRGFSSGIRIPAAMKRDAAGPQTSGLLHPTAHTHPGGVREGGNNMCSLPMVTLRGIWCRPPLTRSVPNRWTRYRRSSRPPKALEPIRYRQTRIS